MKSPEKTAKGAPSLLSESKHAADEVDDYSMNFDGEDSLASSAHFS
jgi:hypothetical protein